MKLQSIAIKELNRPREVPFRNKDHRTVGALMTLLIFIMLQFSASDSHVSAQTVVAQMDMGIYSGRGVAFDPTRSLLYVTCSTDYVYSACRNPAGTSSTIQVVDVATHQIVGTVSVPGVTSSYLVINPATNTLYMSTVDGLKLWSIDLDDNSATLLMNLNWWEPYRVGGFNFDPSSNRVYAGKLDTQSPQSQLYIFDGSDDSLITSVPLSDLAASGGYIPNMPINTSNNRMYLTLGHLDLSTLTPSFMPFFANWSLSWGGVNSATNRLYTASHDPFSFTNEGYTYTFTIRDGDTYQGLSTNTFKVLSQYSPQGEVAVDPNSNRVYFAIKEQDHPAATNKRTSLITFDGSTGAILSRKSFPNPTGQFEWQRMTRNPSNGLLYINQMRDLALNTLWIINPADTVPPSLQVGADIIIHAHGPSGTAINDYQVSASDDSNVSPSIGCNPAAGSIFPIGSTTVACVATDTSGNTAAASFYVNVIDTEPFLSLPEPIFTDATGPNGAPINYIASGYDFVDGQLLPVCDRESGSSFPVGETTVTCTLTDTASNTITGTFTVFVLTSGQTGTPAGSNIPVSSTDSILLMDFQYVEQAGVTTITPIDPGTIGTTPGGFAVSNYAYDIHTTATGVDSYGVILNFVVPFIDENNDQVFDLSLEDFEALTVLHNNNGVLEELNITGRSYESRAIQTYTYSFSPFYLAKRVQKKIEALYSRTTSYQAGSTIPVRIKVRDLHTDANLSSRQTVVSARSVKRLGSGSSAPAVSSGAANADDNFRFVGAGDGGSYIFNLSTRGLSAGRYSLSFYVGGDRLFIYSTEFEIR